MWLKHEFVAIASLFLKVVNETRRLCYMIEGDALLVYKLQDTVKEALEISKDIRDDDDLYEQLN